MLLAPPLTPDADQARRLLQAELADPIYHRDDPSWLTRALRAVADWLAALFDSAAGSAANRWVLAVIVALIATGTVLALRRLPTRRAASRREPLFAAATTSAAEHRRRASAATASGDWEQAVQEYLRAVIRGLEERALIDERPGRTADEAAREAARVLPGCARVLLDGASRFDQVCYGRRPASAQDASALLSLDQAVAAERPLARSVG